MKKISNNLVLLGLSSSNVFHIDYQLFILAWYKNASSNWVVLIRNDLGGYLLIISELTLHVPKF